MEQQFHLKRLIVLMSSVLLVIAQMGAFTYIWFHSYVYLGALDKPFYFMGNFAVIGLYTVMLLLFFVLTKCFRVGHLRIFEVLFTQFCSICCVNAITYLQLCLIGHWRFMTH